MLHEIYMHAQCAGLFVCRTLSYRTCARALHTAHLDPSRGLGMGIFGNKQPTTWKAKLFGELRPAITITSTTVSRTRDQCQDLRAKVFVVLLKSPTDGSAKLFRLAGRVLSADRWLVGIDGLVLVRRCNGLANVYSGPSTVSYPPSPLRLVLVCLVQRRTCAGEK